MSPANLVARLRLSFQLTFGSCASLILFVAVVVVGIYSTVAATALTGLALAGTADAAAAAAVAVMTLSAYSSYSVMLIMHSLLETITYHHILFMFFFLLLSSPLLSFPFFFSTLFVVCRFFGCRTIRHVRRILAFSARNFFLLHVWGVGGVRSSFAPDIHIHTQWLRRRRHTNGTENISNEVNCIQLHDSSAQKI